MGYITRMPMKTFLAVVLFLGLSAGAYAAHGGGGGGSMGGGGHGGGGGEGGEAVIQKKPVDKKKEFSCFKFLMARAEMDPVCRILFDATDEKSDMSGLKDSRYDMFREKLLSTRNGIHYLRALPEAGPSTIPNWCELKKRIAEADEVLRLEKKRGDDRKAEEAEARKDSRKEKQ